MRLISISFTSIDSPGGVPRWNRDLKRFFPELIHYSWDDCPFDANVPEWDKAKTLNAWLRHEKLITKDDIILVDGFWGMGLEDFPNVVSVCHGIWSHRTAEEAEAGMTPDFPLHHAMQVGYRRKHLDSNGRLVAVSKFIASQMRRQWGFESIVINNGVDLERFIPGNRYDDTIECPLIIHGVNDKKNPVKGWDHIEYVKKNVNAKILSLDEAHVTYGGDKYSVLSMADFVLIPSSFEGNSYFLLETLACGVPVVAYDIGLMYGLGIFKQIVGIALRREAYSKEETLNGVRHMLSCCKEEFDPRSIARLYSLEKFGSEWNSYLNKEFSYGH